MRHTCLILATLLAPLLLACGGSGGGGSGGSAAAPTLTSVAPSAGFVLGGQDVLLTGANLTATSAVTFNGAAAAFSVVDDTTIRAVTPVGTAGMASVVITTLDGSVAESLFAYIAYPPAAAGDVQIDDDGSPGGDLPHDATSPTICCSNGVIYVAWADARNNPGGFNLDVFFQRSTDGGNTWAATDIQLNTNAASGTSMSEAPVICCDGDHVHVCWWDDREGTVYEPYCRSSSDGGVTWGPSDARIPQDVTPHDMSEVPQICCSGSTLHVVWTRFVTSVGGSELVYQRTADGGQTWLATDRRLGAFTPARGLGIVSPVLCCGAGVLHVLWADNRRGSDYDIWHTRSTDEGATWSTDQRVDRDTSGRNAALSTAGLNACCEGEALHVIWADDRNAAAPRGGQDLYSNSSSDAGVSFGAADRQVNAHALSGLRLALVARPEICCSGDTIHVVWADNRPQPPASSSLAYNVYAQRSTDGGLSWQASDTLLPVQPSGSSLEPHSVQLCCSGAYVHVAYVRATGGLSDVHAITSVDGGASWPTNTVNLDSNMPANGHAVLGNHAAPAICCDGARPFVVWLDSRNAADPTSGIAYDVAFGRYD